MRLTLSSVVLCVILLFLLGVEVSGECPKCDVSSPAMSGTGFMGANNRKYANIRIDDSWNVDSNGNSISGTNSNLWNAVCAGSAGSGCSTAEGTSAIKMWNETTGSNNSNTPYIFEVNQSWAAHTDIRIVKGNPGGGCASIKYDSQYGYWEMTLADSAKNLSQEALAALIAHEIGHALGLINQEDNECSETIMEGHLPNSCEPSVLQVKQGDVDSAVKHANDHLHCGVQSSQYTGGGDGGGGGGGGGNCETGFDNVSVPNGDCYDEYQFWWIDCGGGPHYYNALYEGSDCYYSE